MRLKWDSSAARDIAVKLGRLEQETEDCMAAIHRGMDILYQMQGGDMSQVIEKYIDTAHTLSRKLQSMAETIGETERAVTRADELFDDLERHLYGKAESMGDYVAAPFHADEGLWYDIAQDGVAPVFYNIPESTDAHSDPWPTLESVNQTVVVDRVSLNADMVTPQWLESFIDSEI